MNTVQPQLTIRPLQESDLATIFSPIAREFGVQWLARQARDEIYIAVVELAGIPVARVGMDFTEFASAGAAHVWAAHVEPEYQSRGIGTALFQHLEEVAKQRGLGEIRLEVGKENLRAQQLYQRLGYEHCGETIDRWSYREGEKVIEVAEDCWSLRKLV